MDTAEAIVIALIVISLMLGYILHGEAELPATDSTYIPPPVFSAYIYVLLSTWFSIRILKGSIFFQAWWFTELHDVRPQDDPLGFWTLVVTGMIIAIFAATSGFWRSEPDLTAMSLCHQIVYWTLSFLTVAVPCAAIYHRIKTRDVGDSGSR